MEFDRLRKFRCILIDSNGFRWFIYWFNDQQIFGVTDALVNILVNII